MICGEYLIINTYITEKRMKEINIKSALLLITLSITLLITGCYSNASKETASDTTEQSAPSQSRPDRY